MSAKRKPPRNTEDPSRKLVKISGTDRPEAGTDKLVVKIGRDKKATDFSGMGKDMHSSGTDKVMHSSGTDKVTDFSASHSCGTDKAMHFSGTDKVTHSSGTDKVIHSRGADKLTHSSGTDKVTHSSASHSSGTDRAVKIGMDKFPAVNLPSNLRPPPINRPIRIYCDGVFDLFHIGHMQALQQAKQLFPNTYLLVGVCNDLDTHAKKGKTVLSDIERYASVAHCKSVDQVIQSAPWIITQEFMDLHQIDYICHDDLPYKSGDCDDVYDFVKAQGRFIPTQRTAGVSTSDLITRIVRDYDAYLQRNIEKGISAKDLNISVFKKNEILARQSIDRISATIHSKLEENEQRIKQKWHHVKLPSFWKSTIGYWEETRSDLVRGFIGLFDTAPRLLFGKPNVQPIHHTHATRTRGSSHASSSTLH